MIYTLVNLVLSTILMVLLVLPTLVGHYFLGPARDLPTGSVAGAKVRRIDSSVVNVLPNTTDFDGYVSFGEAEFREGVYRSQAGVTVFPGQRALYRGLYEVFNLSPARSVGLELITSGLVSGESQVPFERVVVYLGKEEQALSLTRPAEAGDTLLEVSGARALQGSKYVIVGGRVLKVVSVLRDGVVVLPLKKSLEAGVSVYPEAVLLTPDGLKYPKTKEVVIAPGEQVLVNLLVTSGDAARQEKVSLPLELRFQYTQ